MSDSNDDFCRIPAGTVSRSCFCRGRAGGRSALSCVLFGQARESGKECQALRGADDRIHDLEHNPAKSLPREDRKIFCTEKTKKITAPLKSNAAGTAARVSGSKKLTVNKKNGKITIKKGTKKGTYKIKVKITAAGDANHLALSKKVSPGRQSKIDDPAGRRDQNNRMPLKSLFLYLFCFIFPFLPVRLQHLQSLPAHLPARRTFQALSRLPAGILRSMTEELPQTVL